MLIKIPVPDHHARGVNPGIALQTLQFKSMAPELLPGGAVLNDIAKFLFLIELFLELNAGSGLDHFRQHISVIVANTHDACDVTDHALRSQSSVGDNVRNGALPVFLAYVVNDFRTPALAEININIRRADPLRVEESLKEQPKTYRADIGNTHGVSHQRAGCRSTPGTHGNVLVARPLNKVCGDEEVGGKAEVIDGFDLVIETFIEDFF